MDVIRITLHSDLCAGNGESRGNAVDTDIVLTAAGLPRIPARRLKGCLRAAAGELAALGDEAAAYTAELFGDKVGRQGCLWVGDAALPQEAAFTAWLKQNPAWADHSRVEQLYTDVRGQTRLKDGVADDGSLRFTRVLGQYDPLDKTKRLCLKRRCGWKMPRPRPCACWSTAAPRPVTWAPTATAAWAMCGLRTSAARASLPHRKIRPCPMRAWSR